MWVIDGNKVKRQRLSRHMTQKDLAFAMEPTSDPTYISNLENAPRGRESGIDIVMRLSAALECEIPDLLSNI